MNYQEVLLRDAMLKDAEIQRFRNHGLETQGTKKKRSFSDLNVTECHSDRSMPDGLEGSD
jgi:hypothetical protein